MSYLKSAAFVAAFMLIANTSFAVDHRVDRLAHELDEHVTELENEVHAHHVGGAVDAYTHQLHEEVHEFIEHIHHGDPHHQLHRFYQPVRRAIQRLKNASGHYDVSWHGWRLHRRWHWTVPAHVATEIQHIEQVDSQLWHHFHGWGHGHGHHPHH